MDIQWNDESCSFINDLHVFTILIPLDFMSARIEYDTITIDDERNGFHCISVKKN